MEAKDKRAALRAINYGVYICTAIDGDEIGAAGINWVSQTSFEPPLVMVGVKADSDTHAIIKRSGGFAISVLAEDQLDIGKGFFRPTVVEGNTLNGFAFASAPVTGAPVLVDLPYWFEARVTDTIERGDHTMFVGEVVGAGVNNDEATPLLLRSTGMFYGG